MDHITAVFIKLVSFCEKFEQIWRHCEMGQTILGLSEIIYTLDGIVLKAVLMYINVRE